jgi:UDP-N-acetylmuramate dehydrogenase
VAELLRGHTTLRVGGAAHRWVEATTQDELIEAVSAADQRGEQVLVLGGGSNLLVADDGFAGTVIKLATQGMVRDTDSDEASCGGVTVRIDAGVQWDTVVAEAVEVGWVGIEALSGIPGSVGATPIQNVGAYGQDVAQTVASVRVWDRKLRGVRTFANADCGFGYRHSRFKADPGRHVVLDVTFQFRQGDLGAPVVYAELARALGVGVGERAPMADVRDAVLGLRRGKGMVLDADDHDTWSAGSFFTNPVVAAEAVPDGAPTWPAEGGIKVSAAWLIEHAGFRKGYGADLTGGRASLSTKHTLALTNRGGASAEDLLAVAREVREGVERAYGIRLVNEPVLVGCTL